MAKRILAIVMALVLSLSLLSVEVFADTSGTVNVSVSGNTLSLSWESLGSASKYVVTVTNTAGTTLATTTVTTNSAKLTVNSYGTVNISVIAYNSSNVVVGSFTGSAYVAQSSTGSGVTVSGNSTGSSTISWSAVAGVSTYYVSWTGTGTGNSGNATTSDTSYTISVDYTNLSSVTVRIGNASGNIVGSWTNRGTGTGTGTGTGSVSLSGTTLYWNSYGYNTAYYAVYVGSQYIASTYSTSYNVARYLSNGITFTVVAVASNGTRLATIGSYTYYVNGGYGGGYGYGSGYGNGLYLSGTTLSWNNYGYNVSYYAVYVNNTYATRTSTGSETSIDVSRYLSTYNGAVTFRVDAIGLSGSTLGTVGTYTYNGYNSGYNPGYGTGNVWISGSTLCWNGGVQGYYVSAVTNTGVTLLNHQSVGSSTTLYIPSYIGSQYLANYSSISFTVYTFTNGQYTSIGSAVYYSGYNNGGSNNGVSYGGLIVDLGVRFADISWNAVSGVYGAYQITYVINGVSRSYTTTDTHFSVEWTGGVYVTVQYNYNGRTYTIGSCNISSNGQVSYNGGSVNNGGNTNNGTTTSNGCYLNVGTTSTSVTWNAVSGAIRYSLIYTNNDTGSNARQDVYTTGATIPLGSSNCSSFTVNVVPIGSNGLAVSASSIMSATYNRSAGSTQSGTSTTKGLTLKENGSNSTTVSWEPYTNANYYLVMYNRFEDNVGQEQVLTKTSFELPIGKRIGYEIVVYASLRDGSMRVVGSAIHYANDEYSSSGTTTPADSSASVYVTGLKGTIGNGQVRLAWNAAQGATSYKVYWKRANKSEWNLAKTTSSRSLTISGLNNGTSYDFKVVANGYDSSILNATPSKNSSSTVTAPDPSGAGASTSKVPEITSITGGSGSMNIEWKASTGAKAYQVWIAKSGSNQYAVATSTQHFPNAKVTISGTTATITGLAAGTYKVRIKASTDGTNWPTLAEASSDFATVTVR